MFVEFKNAEKDLLKFIKIYFIQHELYKRILLIVALALIIGNFRLNNESFVLSSFIFKTAIAFVILLIVVIFIPYIIALFTFKKYFKSASFSLPQKISLQDEGVNVFTNNENTFWRWETLHKSGIVDDYLFFTLFKNKLFIIPLKCFSSRVEAINFLRVIQNNILKYKGQSKPRKISNLYYWGLVGILPNFGVVAGIILLVKGFQLKDKKLVLIGIADILFTIIFWTAIFTYINK